MYELKTADPDSWAFQKQNFLVNKTRLDFSAIGQVHAIEHENRAMNVFGGIKGIANKPATLDHYFLVMPEISNIIDEFNTVFGVERNS